MGSSGEHCAHGQSSAPPSASCGDREWRCTFTVPLSPHPTVVFVARIPTKGGGGGMKSRQVQCPFDVSPRPLPVCVLPLHRLPRPGPLCPQRQDVLRAVHCHPGCGVQHSGGWQAGAARASACPGQGRALIPDGSTVCGRPQAFPPPPYTLIGLHQVPVPCVVHSVDIVSCASAVCCALL